MTTKPKRGPRPHPTNELILALYGDAALVSAIAARTGRTESAVRSLISRQGARRPSRNPAPPGPHPTNPLVLALWAAGVPVEEVAARTGRTPNAIRRLASIHGVKRPKRPKPPKAERPGRGARPHATTALVLELWAAGVPVEEIAARTGRTPNAIRVTAFNKGVRRPPGYRAALLKQNLANRKAA